MYTIGKFGEKTGLSRRTLRFYEELGILLPGERNESGHRLYGLEELAILQRIQSLKFIGYSLQEIKKILSTEEITLETITKSLPIQRKILVHKREELDRAISAIDHVHHLLQNDIPLDWNALIPLLYSIEFEDEQTDWVKEHFQDDLRKSLINIPKEQRKELDKEWLLILAEVKALIKNNVPPHAPEAQQVLIQMKDIFLKTIPEESIPTLENWNEQIDSAGYDEFVAPNFWTKEEEDYLENILKAMVENSIEKRGR